MLFGQLLGKEPGTVKDLSIKALDSGLQLNQERLYLNSIDLNISDSLTIILFGVFSGLFLRFVFKRYSNTFSSKTGFGNTIVLVTISVASLIAVVKSSLALSLGLVGALSVVRFRTAVKEPFNLAFILLSICVGIAIGASQYLFAILVGLIGSAIVIFLYKEESILSKNARKSSPYLDTLVITLPFGSDLCDLYKILSDKTNFFSLRSLEQNGNEFICLTIKLNINTIQDLDEFRNQFNDKYPKADISFLNSPNN